MKEKKSRLNYLVSLVSALSESELHNLKKYLGCFDTNFHDQHKVKTLQLLEYLLERNLEVDEKEIARAISDGNTSSLKFLCIRLIDKIYEVFQLDIYVGKKGHYKELTQNYLKILKEFAVIRVLFDRRIYTDLLRKVNQVIRRAIENEFYPQLLEALELKREFVAFWKGFKESEKISAEIEVYEEIYGAQKKAKTLYAVVRNQASLKSGNLLNLDQFDTQIRAIGKVYRKYREDAQYQLGNLGYFYHLCAKSYYNSVDDYPSAALEARAILDLMDKYGAVNERFRRAGIYIQLANVELFNRRPDQSLKFALEAQAIFPPNHPNWVFAVEYEILGLYYLERYEEAAQAIDKLSGRAGPGSSLEERLAYSRAALLFREGKLGKAFIQLQNVQGLMNDQEGWNIGVRLLLIMIQIENGIIWIDNSLDNLRKQITKLRKSGVLKKRYRLIYEVLKQLNRNSLDFYTTFEKQKENLGHLNSDAPEYRWETNNHELINFASWFSSHVKT